MQSLDSLLDQAADALEDGRPEEALASSEAALRQQPKDLEALGLRAAALAELGRWEEADRGYANLIAREPDEPAWGLAAAELMLRQPGDDPERVEAALALLGKIERQAAKDERLHFEWLMLEALALNQAGELSQALESLEQALGIDPDEPDAKLEHAVTLFELGRLEDAGRELAVLAEQLPDDPLPPHYLGLLAEREGQVDKAGSYFARATELDPDAFPPPSNLSEEEFDAAVKAAIAQLPEHARAELSNVTISVEPFPDDETLRSGEVTPTILGVFFGTALDERNPTVAEHHRTAQIILYQRNLERAARSRAELVEQIGITVLHEVGHLLGLDEDELYQRGLD